MSKLSLYLTLITNTETALRILSPCSDSSEVSCGHERSICITLTKKCTLYCFAPFVVFAIERNDEQPKAADVSV